MSDITVELASTVLSAGVSGTPLTLSVTTPSPVSIDVSDPSLNVSIAPSVIQVSIAQIGQPGASAAEQQFYLGGSEPAAQTKPKLWLSQVSPGQYEMKIVEAT